MAKMRNNFRAISSESGISTTEMEYERLDEGDRLEDVELMVPADLVLGGVRVA